MTKQLVGLLTWLAIAVPPAVFSQTQNQTSPPTAAPAAAAATPSTAPTNSATPPPTHVAAATVPAGKSVSQSLGMLVYPAKQQSPSQQSQDENECYGWSKTQSGYDPAAAANQPQQATTQQPAQSETNRSGVRSAAKGAAAGAAIGAIAGDAGKGAAIGGGVGGVKGIAGKRREEAKREGAAEQQQAAQAQANAEEQQKLDTFKRGMTACLEGRGYTIK